MVSTAVIMAAGMGTRFGQYTEFIPKGFVEVNGIPMVVRSIETLISAGINKIIIGTGWHSEAYEKLSERYPQIVCKKSARYAETNCMYTLWNCRDEVGGSDILMLDSDLIYDKAAITSLLQSPYDSAILATPVVKFQDSYFVEKDCNNRFIAWSTDASKLNPCGELVGIHKLSNSFFKAICNDFENMLPSSEKSSYEPFFLRASLNVHPIYIHLDGSIKWYEIDDENDLKIAEQEL